ncbi:MAG: ferric reductase-like transmembrane domain-containing protein, partial [Rhodospirillaceae bacterium]
MRRATPALLGTGFVLAHVALLAPFVPATDILSMGSGLLSLSAMALTMALAARWQWVDHVMGGPDKSYVAHRWLGFFALGGALVHWVTADDSGRGIVPFLADSAEGVGTFAVVGLLALSAAAMVRIIPYHLWKKSHMLMGPLFIAAAYHSIFAASPLALGSPPWIVMAGMSVLGLVGWGQTLLRKSASTALVTVDRVTRFDGGVDVHVTSETALAGFRPGQFATISYDAAGAESHPFTIAGGDAFSRRFVIRAGGDWTNRFVKSVQPGDQLRLGASVGRFRPQFQETRTEQLWVAGGVGITPF